MTENGTQKAVVIKRSMMDTILRRAFEYKSGPGIPDPSSLSNWIFRGMLEGMFRSIHDLGRPQYGVSFNEMASASQRLHRSYEEGVFLGGGGLRDPVPWKNADVAKAKFYEWRRATQAGWWKDVREVGPDAGEYRASLVLHGKNSIGYFTASLTFEDGSPDGVPVQSLPAPARRPSVSTNILDIIPELSGLADRRVPEVDLFGADIAVNSILFDTPVVLYANHEYVLEGLAFGKVRDWYGRINWGDGDEEDFVCGETVSHVYRAPIERSAITLTLVYPEPKARTVLIEVRRFGLPDSDSEAAPRKKE